MAFVVVYDASVLHPPNIRDLLIRLAQKGLFQAKWSEAILDECFDSIFRRRPDLSIDKLARTRELMNRAVRDSLVEGYETLMAGLSLPDPDDVHVLAAAIKSGAQVIVTENLKDFPPEYLDPWGMAAQRVDDFVLSLIEMAEPVIVQVVEDLAGALKNPRMTVSGVLALFEQNGLAQSVARLRAAGLGQ